MSEDKITATEQKIIDAAVLCIEKYGVQGTTNRKIAEMAGVNNAAINYYFRSKDVLVQRVMEVTLNNAFDWEDFSKLPYGNPKQRCYVVFNDLVKGGCEYPGVTRAHFYEMFATGNTGIPGVQRYNEFIEKLACELEELGSELSHDELRLALMQIGAAVMMMIQAPDIYQSKFGLDVRNEADRQKYLSRLVDRLL